MAISITPQVLTNAAGLFNTTSDGYVQGTALDDPAARYALNQGVVGGSGLVVWGGMGITETTANPTNQPLSVGGVITLATSQANLTGFTVFNQATAMIQSPQSPVPLAQTGMSVDYYRLGSGARIPVQCTSTIAAALEGVAINTAVYWDYTNQVLLNAPGGTAIAVKVISVNVGNSMVVSYTTPNGTWNRSGSVAIIQI